MGLPWPDPDYLWTPSAFYADGLIRQSSIIP
jgi:hypothetical protein